jgi:tetratricopeptide (TPR) repeat protein
MRRAVLPLTLGLVLAVPARAEWTADAMLCGKAAGDEAIGACTRALESGLLTLEEQARVLNGRGVIHLRERDLDRALADLEGSVSLAPNRAEAYNDRGLVYLDKGDFDRATADFDQAIAIKPDYALPYHNRGNAHRRKGELEQAIADYDQAIRLKPDYAQAYGNRGIARAAKGNLDGAITDFEMALASTGLDRAGQTKARTERGNAYVVKGDLDSAIADYDAALNLDPGYAIAYNNRGYAHELKGDTESARRDYRKALALDPGYARAKSNLAELEAKLGDTAMEFGRPEPELVRRAQAGLNALGYNAGTEDGVPGRGTTEAVRAFLRAQRELRLSTIDSALVAMIEQAVAARENARPVVARPAPSRVEAPVVAEAQEHAAREPITSEAPSIGRPQPGLVEGMLTSALRSRPYTAVELTDPVTRSMVEQCERVGNERCRNQDSPEAPRSSFARGVDPRVIAFFRLARLTPGAIYDWSCRMLDPSGSVVAVLRDRVILPAGALPGTALTLQCSKELGSQVPVGNWAIDLTINGERASVLRFTVTEPPDSNPA